MTTVKNDVFVGLQLENFHLVRGKLTWGDYKYILLGGGIFLGGGVGGEWANFLLVGGTPPIQ